MKEYEIKTAIIKHATITKGEHGVLSIWLGLDYGGAGQGFGGFALYNPSHAPKGLAGHFIWRVMEIAGVDEWDEVAGQAIRVKMTPSEVVAIGHIVKDDWFELQVDFKDTEQNDKVIKSLADMEDDYRPFENIEATLNGIPGIATGRVWKEHDGKHIAGTFLVEDGRAQQELALLFVKGGAGILLRFQPPREKSEIGVPVGLRKIQCFEGPCKVEFEN